ncbi:hypothetical protein RI129_004595 [Pyrocoelia pectoralis]|uniref:Adaptor protein enigma n=1 Tax=Pyrocoelia pectoralis TaxID=417401 RepID=A0AAN7ZR27_9COLE
MANLICVRLNKGDAPSWGFRLQGGKDFGTPLVVQKVIGGSPAERAGLIAGDTVIKINNTDVLHLRHKDAQDVILRAGNAFDVAIQRGGSTWKPNVVPVGSISAVPSAAPLSNNISPVTHTSLAASKQDSIGSIGTGHNVSAKPYHQLNGGPKLVNKQYNSPLPIYSEQSIAETLSAQTEVLANGVLGVNFKKNEKSYDAANSEVFRMVQEADKEPKDYEPEPDTSSSGVVTAPLGIAGLKHVSAPENKPAPPTPQLPPGQNICADCERLIVGVFVRIKDKNLHVECFKCATCGSSLKNVGYYNLNNKLYCDVHAKLAARSNPPAPNLQPITIPPGSKIPSGTISAALSSHSLPSPSSLSPNTNYSAAPYQPGSSYTTPKPFSSVTSPLSPIYTPISPTSTPYTGRSGVKPGAPYRVTFDESVNDANGENKKTYYSEINITIPSQSNGIGNDKNLTPTPILITDNSQMISPRLVGEIQKVTNDIEKISFIDDDDNNEIMACTSTNKLVPKPASASVLHSTNSLLTIDQRKQDANRPSKNDSINGHNNGIGLTCCVCRSEKERGPFITALGKIWCPDHFICATPSCRRPLHDLGFVEEHGQLYCEYCFEQYLAPPCSKCNTKIKGDCLKAIGRNFHPECFNCVYCGKLFGNSPFFLEDAQPYCETDWNELFTTKCFACGFPVEAGDRWVEALSNNYHSQCFNCTMCKKNLEGQSFFAKGGRPFCKNHAR